MINLIKDIQAEENEVLLGQIGGEGSSLLQGAGGIYRDGTINWAILVGKIAQLIFFGAAVTSLFFLIWGGITLITSSGETSKKTVGRDRMVYAAIGLLITASAFALWKLVLGVAGIDELNPGF